MKNWTSLTFACALLGFACATWIHAASTNLFTPEYPAPVSVPTTSSPEVQSKVKAQRHALDLALADIRVTGQSPEALRAAFTNYWHQRVNLDLSELQPWEQDKVKVSIKIAHLTRVSELSKELEAEPKTWELQYVAKELIRGAKATAEEL